MMKIRSLFLKVSFRESFQQSALLTVGTVMNSVLGLFFYILMARGLSITSFGYFSFLLGLGVMAAEIGDLGLSSALVRFGIGEKFREVFSIVFGGRLIVGVIVLALALVAGRFYPAQFELSALVGFSLLLVSLVSQGFLAKQKYGGYALTNIFGNLVRLGLVGFIYLSGQLTAGNGLIVFGVANLVAFGIGFLGVAIAEKRFPIIRVGQRAILKEVVSYSRWMALSFSLTSLAAKIDVPLVFILGGGAAAGIYSSAQKLASVFSQILVALEGVFSPKFASAKAFSGHFREFLGLAVFLVVGILIITPTANFLVPLFLGIKYQAATGVFQLLLLGLVPLFLGGPFSAAVLYRFGRSGYHLLISAIQLAVALVLYLYLVPFYGAYGAAITFIVVSTISLVLYVFIYRRFSSEYSL